MALLIISLCFAASAMTINDKEQCSERLDEYPISSLDSVYEKIYADHNSSDQVEYTLSVSVRDLYRKFIGQTPEGQDNEAKVAKNLLKLKLVMHVFYDRIRKALDSSLGPTARIVPGATMKMAISLCSTLSHVKASMDLVSIL